MDTAAASGPGRGAVPVEALGEREDEAVGTDVAARPARAAAAAAPLGGAVCAARGAGRGIRDALRVPAPLRAQGGGAGGGGEKVKGGGVAAARRVVEGRTARDGGSAGVSAVLEEEVDDVEASMEGCAMKGGGPVGEGRCVDVDLRSRRVREQRMHRNSISKAQGGGAGCGASGQDLGVNNAPRRLSVVFLGGIGELPCHARRLGLRDTRTPLAPKLRCCNSPPPPRLFPFHPTHPWRNQILFLQQRTWLVNLRRLRAGSTVATVALGSPGTRRPTHGLFEFAFIVVDSDVSNCRSNLYSLNVIFVDFFRHVHPRYVISSS